MFAIDDGSFLILGVLVEFDTELEAELLELFGGVPIIVVSGILGEDIYIYSRGRRGKRTSDLEPQRGHTCQLR